MLFTLPWINWNIFFELVWDHWPLFLTLAMVAATGMITWYVTRLSK